MKAFKRWTALAWMTMALFLVLFVTGCSVDVGGGDKSEEPAVQESVAEGDAQAGDESQDASSGTAQAGEKIVEKAEPGFHIGIVTGTVAQGEDEFRGAEQALKDYGDASEGGMIVLDTYPDNFMAEQETTISKIVAMADDPQMKAIIVNQSVPGTSAAFEQIRQKNPDILLIGLTPQEDTVMIESAADLAVDLDNISRGYRLVAAAKEMGATKFAHISFPRHMSVELLALRRAIMVQACEDLGLEFISLTAPDPTSDMGIPGAQQFIAENIGPWIQKYGKDTAFYCTNDAHTEPLLRGISQNGAIFVEQDLPSPIMGYPGAFSLELEDVAGDWQAINKRVEDAVVAAGNSGRMGSWVYSFGYTTTLGTVDFVKNLLENGGNLLDREALLKAYEGRTPGAMWMSSNYIDRVSGQSIANHILLSQDTYVYGKGFLGLDKEPVPEKYLKLNVEDVAAPEDDN